MPRLADFLKIGLDETAKAVFMVAEIEETEQKSYEKFVFVVVRGDMEVNETKLSNAINAKRMRPANDRRNSRHRRRTGLWLTLGH